VGWSDLWHEVVRDCCATVVSAFGGDAGLALVA
jgi:hypothetical protein